MCLICVEYNKKRMTREEIRKALPEMVMFAKTEDEKNHFKKLQVLGDSLDEKPLEEFANDYTSTLGKKTR
jgi:rubrerythrin